MRIAITAATLVLALSCPAYAGDMPNGDTGGTTSTIQGETQGGADGLIPNDGYGWMPNGGTDAPPQTSNALDGLDATFGVLRTLLGLF